MKNGFAAIILVAVIALIIGAGGFFAYQKFSPNPPSSPSPSAIPKLESGIIGKTTIGPTCPIQRPGQVCLDRPIQATIIVKTQDGEKEITRFSSGTDGTFKISLPPGTYSLDPQNPNSGPLPYSKPTDVTVEQGKYTDIIIGYDTGIR